MVTGPPAVFFPQEFNVIFNALNVCFVMKKKLIIFILIAGVLQAGCNKSLDIANPNTPTTENFWKTAGDAQRGVNAIYSTFHRQGLSRWYFFATLIRSDEGQSTSPNPDLQ